MDASLDESSHIDRSSSSSTTESKKTSISDESFVNLEESTPTLSKFCSIQKNILEFVHSYGYDCKRMCNLCLIDQDALVFHSGNLIHFFEMSTRQITTRRTTQGGGVGHITKNPNSEYNYLTIAENGIRPPIIIYEWPSLNIISVLKGGTLRTYSYVDYTADGEQMLSQGSDPDYMITIWNWKAATVILKCKSFSNDIFVGKFSLYDYGQLSTGGQTHIKFWKICQTYTGLKLIGRHGRFGKTEISDIMAIFIMPSEQVLSGSLWGNVLVWEDSYIRVEVCRKNRKTCHIGAITQIYQSSNNANEIITIGMDGYVRIWFWETVDLANPSDTDPFVEIEPLFEYKIGSIGHTTSLMTMIKWNEMSNWWICQDGNGGIWKCDLSPQDVIQPSEMLFRCHAGQVIGMGCCPFAMFIATLGEDGRLHIYDYNRQKLDCFRQFPANGRAIIWLPSSVDPTGCVIVLGFDDGTLKLVVVGLDEYVIKSSERIKLIQVLKPHSKAITKLSINVRETILVSGSEDNTIFISQILKGTPCVKLIPIGFIDVPSAVTALAWKPNMYSTILLGCALGEILEMDLPEVPRTYTNDTYKFEHIQLKKLVFKSVKSEIRRQLKMQKIDKRKQKKRKRKLIELERIRAENPDVMIAEEAFLADSSSDEELEPIYIPKIPNRILWLQYTPDKTIWVSMAGYDAGYIYEYQFGHSDPILCTIIKNGDDIEIHSYLYFENFLVFGMQDGTIRINKQQDNFRDLSDYWILNMHSNCNGTITAIQLTYDNQYVFSVGSDGNIFQYKWNFELDYVDVDDVIDFDFDAIEEVHDITDRCYLSIEQQKQKQNDDAHQKIIDEKKQKIRRILSVYEGEFREIVRRNKNLIKSQQLPMEIFELDDRISQNLEDSLQALQQLERQKIAFDVERTKIRAHKVEQCLIRSLDDLPVHVMGIRINCTVRTFRMPKLSDGFAEYQAYAEERIKNEMERRRAIDLIEDTVSSSLTTSKKGFEIFMPEITDTTLEQRLNLQFKRLLKKCRYRKQKEQEQLEKWQYIYSIEPDPNVNDPNDDKAIEEAKQTTGDYKLKSDRSYLPNGNEREATSRKFLELLAAREEADRLRNDYNCKVFALQKRKYNLIQEILATKEKLKDIHVFLPNDLQMSLDASLTQIKFPAKMKEQIQNSLEHQNASTFDKQSRIWSHLMIVLLKQTTGEVEFENELRSRNVEQRLFEQSQILSNIEERIQEFDNEIRNLRDSLMQIEVDSKFLDLFVLTLNQELWVLKDFERLEDGLIENIDQNAIIRNKVQAKLISNKNKMRQLKDNIAKFKDQEQLIQQQFLTNCKGNRFYGFLKRIYQKRLKVTTELDSMASSSSSSDDESSSEEEEGADDDSRYSVAGMGHAYLDENVCPSGCDPQLYELSFDLRSRRHLLEQNKKQAEEEIEAMRIRNIGLEKEMKMAEAQLNAATNDLQEFTREKQTIINQIDAMVILKMDQMRYFRNEEEFGEVANTFLFKSNIIRILYARVGELKIEAIEVRRKHRINVVHLSRLKTDCKYMEALLAQLHKDSQAALLKKFGMILDLNELEETLLRNFLNIMNGNIDKVQKEYQKKTADLKKTYTKRQENLKQAMEEGIEKLNILTVLQEDQNILSVSLAVQAKIKEKGGIDDGADVFETDLFKLRALSQQLDQQIASLEKEILTLRLKAKPFAPISTQRIHFSSIVEDENAHYCKTSPRSCGSCSEHICTPTVRYGTIIKIVQKFLHARLQGKIKMSDLVEPTYKLGTIFIELIDNYGKLQINEINKHMIESFQKVFAEDLLKYFPKRDIEVLTGELIRQFEDDTEINVDELLVGLIDDIFDSISISSNLKCYTEDIFTEILNGLVDAFSITDAFSLDRIGPLAKILSKMRDLRPKEVDTRKILDAVMDHVLSDSLEFIEIEKLNQFLDQLIERLQKYQPRPIK